MLEEVWYASYGSNLYAARFGCYLAGGQPPGAQRVYEGARDPSPPRATRAVTVPGQVYFALESLVWGGGMAFLDPEAPGTALLRAYRISTEQFADVCAQEMGQSSGSLEVHAALAALTTPGVTPGAAPGVAVAGHTRVPRYAYGSGRYETLVGLGEVEGVPMVSFTAPWSLAEAEVRAPSGAYLCMLGAGLMEAHGLDAQGAARYLAGLAGAAGHWTAETIEALLVERQADGLTG